MATKKTARSTTPAARGHRSALLTAQDIKRLPKLYSTQNTRDPKVYVKLFHPYGAGTFLITEFDGNDTMFGATKIFDDWELGYISLSELMALRGPMGVQGIERDISFVPKPLSQAKREG